MILLGIDTCGSLGTVAVGRVLKGNGLQVLGTAELAGRTTAADLVPSLKAMLAKAEVSLSAIEGIVVVDGPGSFTGIRIGLSTAKALAEAAALPLFAISRLRVMSRAAGSAAKAALDAGRGEFYYGYYADAAGAEGIPALKQSVSDGWAGGGAGEWLLSPAEAAELVRRSGAPVVCEETLLALLPGSRLVAPPAAADALRAALSAVQAGVRSDVAALDGRYIRRSDLYRTSGSPTA